LIVSGAGGGAVMVVRMLLGMAIFSNNWRFKSDSVSDLIGQIQQVLYILFTHSALSYPQYWLWR
jgi:hypothetical protein